MAFLSRLTPSSFALGGVSAESHGAAGPHPGGARAARERRGEFDGAGAEEGGRIHGRDSRPRLPRAQTLAPARRNWFMRIGMHLAASGYA